MPAVNMRQAFFIMSLNNYLDPNSSQSKDALLQQAWNRENDDLLSSWFNPGSQQREEFSQEIVLQQMQNEWNSESERMKRMMDAGINANVAAAGIAGSGSSPSVGSPNSAVGAGAQGLGAAAQFASAANEAVNAGVNAYEKLSLTPSKKAETKANIRNLLSTALHNDWLAYAVSEMLPLQKSNERADTWLKLANFDKAREEKKLINKRISEVEAHIVEMNNQADLYEKQGNLVDADKLRVEAETAQVNLQNDKLKWDKDWRERFKYDPNVPVDVALEQAMVNDAGDDVVNAIGSSVKEVAYDEQKGINQAEIEDAFEKFRNKIQGEETGRMVNAKFFADIENYKKVFSLIGELYLASDGRMDGLAHRLVSLLGSELGLDSKQIEAMIKDAFEPVK